MNFYERCEQLVKENKITMKELGEKVGVTGASITGWKTGSLPRVDVALKVAKYFGVTVEYLMDGTETNIDLFPEEKKLIQWYRQTSHKRNVLEYAKSLSVIKSGGYLFFNEGWEDPLEEGERPTGEEIKTDENGCRYTAIN